MPFRPAVLLILALSVVCSAQPPLAPEPTPENVLTPTWETQKQARTFFFQVPAPRGQITDRNGNPLAQTRVSYNLAIEFPTPLNFSDTGALNFALAEIRAAEVLIGRPIEVSDEAIVKHYRNRGILPFDIVQDLSPQEAELLKKRAPESLGLHAVYQRFYPNGRMAGHIIGYAGRAGRQADGVIQNNDLLWPNSEGREGLEQTFNEQLTGKMGQLNIAFDARGKKASEKISIPPQPGYNVITTIDENLQRLCERVLERGAKRGAIVITDPNNGDVLAMASWPVFNPNAFIPTISAEAFKALRDDPNIPLLPRAYRSAYPPGSTFKVIVGLAALESETITRDDEFPGPASMKIGNLVFRNWKHSDSGMLNFRDALTQSCDTWFYQVGIKTGADWVTDWAFKCGLGLKTGLPLKSEAEGRVPTNDYMLKVYGRKLVSGDMANLSIGQGDMIVTPLQMAQAMAAVGNGGTLYKARLVKQIQTIDSRIVTAYDVRIKNQFDIKAANLAEIKKAMVAVVSSRSGTAGKAHVPGIDVAGKTGTAQWGPKNNERNAAWFAGFAPADKPQYAFAAIYESDPKQDAHGGTYAAPMIGKVLGEVFKQEKQEKKTKKKKAKAEPKEEEKPETQEEPQQQNQQD